MILDFKQNIYKRKSEFLTKNIILCNLEWPFKILFPSQISIFCLWNWCNTVFRFFMLYFPKENIAYSFSRLFFLIQFSSFSTITLIICLWYYRYNVFRLYNLTIFQYFVYDAAMQQYIKIYFLSMFQYFIYDFIKTVYIYIIFPVMF